MNDLLPPWVLFSDQGKPIAILPALGTGEVANVDGLTLEDANKIVKLANEAYEDIQNLEQELIRKSFPPIQNVSQFYHDSKSYDSGYNDGLRAAAARAMMFDDVEQLKDALIKMAEDDKKI